jgi:hypothetical protein
MLPLLVIGIRSEKHSFSRIDQFRGMTKMLCSALGGSSKFILPVASSSESTICQEMHTWHPHPCTLRKASEETPRRDGAAYPTSAVVPPEELLTYFGLTVQEKAQSMCSSVNTTLGI